MDNPSSSFSQGSPQKEKLLEEIFFPFLLDDDFLLTLEDVSDDSFLLLDEDLPLDDEAPLSLPVSSLVLESLFGEVPLSSPQAEKAKDNRIRKMRERMW
jgi:hypothetical protein